MINWKADLNSLVDETMAFVRSVRVEPPLPHTIVEPNRMPSVNWMSSEREEIGQRVANFKAHQQRFMREREDYAASERVGCEVRHRQPLWRSRCRGAQAGRDRQRRRDNSRYPRYHPLLPAIRGNRWRYAVGDENERSSEDRRARIDRRSGTDARSDEEKQRVGERRSQLDRRSGPMS
jgi:hypothetical protein